MKPLELKRCITHRQQCQSAYSFPRSANFLNEKQTSVPREKYKAPWTSDVLISPATTTVAERDSVALDRLVQRPREDAWVELQLPRVPLCATLTKLACPSTCQFLFSPKWHGRSVKLAVFVVTHNVLTVNPPYSNYTKQNSSTMRLKSATDTIS